MLKLVHCADLHLDSPFRSESAEKSEIRRRELRGTFARLIMFIKENKIDICLLSGDLFDLGYVTRDTAMFVASQLETVPDCSFIISPGNHDPYSDSGVYGTTAFPPNVHIFKGEGLSKLSIPRLGADIYGYAFTSPTMEKCPFVGRVPDSASNINILCGHGDVGVPASPYCPISERDIAESGFDYYALGHVHKSEGVKKVGNSHYAYSGCLEGRDFGETGHKGALYIELAKSQGLVVVKSRFVPLSQRRYEVCPVDVSGAESIEAVYATVKSAMAEARLGSDTLLRVILQGCVSPSLDIDLKYLTSRLCELVFYIEIENSTVPTLSAKELESDPTLRGAFYRELMPLLQGEDGETRTEAGYALRIGLAAIAGQDFTEL